MVKAVDIESLLQKYVEEENLEKCDALYLLWTTNRSDAAKTLRIRYGRSGALNSILDDLKELGIEEIRNYIAEDTEEMLEEVVEASFEKIALDRLLEAAKTKANTLSRLARELLYLISLVYPRVNPLDFNDLGIYHRILFQEQITQPEFEKAVEELVRCYVIHYIDYSYSSSPLYIHFPPYIDTLLHELREFMPEVEVNVLWKG